MKTPPSTQPSNTIRNLVILVLLGGVVGLTLWALQLRREQDALAVRAQPRSATAGSNPARSEVPPGSAATAEPAELPAPPAAEPKSPANPMAAMVTQMMNNPATRAMVLERTRRTMEAQYTDAFDRFAFTADQRKRFMDTMMEMTAGSTDLTMRLMSGSGTTEEREAISRDLASARDAANATMRNFFAVEFPDNPGMNDAFESYAERRTDRTQVTALQGSLTQAGEPLSPEQAEALVDILYSERRSTSTTAAGETSAVPDLGGATSPDATDRRLRRQEETNERVAARAAALLSPAQLAALREQQAARLQSLRAGAEMSRLMFAPGQTEAK